MPSLDDKRTDAGRPRLVTDQQVFEALAVAITDHGPHRWTLAQVAGQLGLTGPALGYRFGNKHGLLLAFAAHQPEATAQHFDAVNAGARSPRDAIVDALVGLTGNMRTRAEVANNIAMLSLDLTDDDLAGHARRQTQVIKSRIAALLADCGTDPAAAREALAEELYIIWSGAIISWAIDGTGTLATWTGRKLDAALRRHGI